jgi:hypothetical protein
VIAHALTVLDGVARHGHEPMWRQEPALFELGWLTGYHTVGGYRTWISPRGRQLLETSRVTYTVLMAAGLVAGGRRPADARRAA